MSREKFNKLRHDHCCFLYVSIIIVAFALSLSPAYCQDIEGYDDNPATQELFSELVYKSFSNFTSVFKQDIAKYFGFCITDVDEDWNMAFNFSKGTQFISNCAKKTNGDMLRRICTAAEIKFYFNNLFEKGAKKSNYLKPNKNCNLSSWVSGCEPGWACGVGKGEKVDLRNSKDMPFRSTNCAACCEGFFCPHGITCMIPCPLGAHCPLAKLNKTTGICDPYHYQLPPGKPNHTCGGADIWADILSSSEIFCSAGLYCPSTIQEIPCSRSLFSDITAGLVQRLKQGVLIWQLVKHNQQIRISLHMASYFSSSFVHNHQI
ncbi:hypothetical protein OIU77_026739 [Salix suchowensis]|uniref:Uncharacterized protein n=1 Tax=Salix suchowensis TaxID=1278906 RepID=A0ABQ9BMB2_9ROSI|nr:hypothetical protein OIU77_026739 [Salix suchowensis]